MVTERAGGQLEVCLLPWPCLCPPPLLQQHPQTHPCGLLGPCLHPLALASQMEPLLVSRRHWPPLPDAGNVPAGDAFCLTGPFLQTHLHAGSPSPSERHDCLWDTRGGGKEEEALSAHFLEVAASAPYSVREACSVHKHLPSSLS